MFQFNYRLKVAERVKARPLRKAAPFPIAAIRAVAVTGPTP